MKNKETKLNILFCLLLTFVFLPGLSQAATLYFSPDSGQYQKDDVFVVDLKLDNEEECINTVEVNIGFSNDILEVIDFNESNSLLSIWLKKPEINQSEGTISLAGGIPGGFCGKLPGDPGNVDLIGQIIFKVKSQDNQKTSIDFNDSQVLLNDGEGTRADLKTRGASFSIISGVSEKPLSEWEEKKENDFTMPEPFSIEIIQDSSIFDNKYFIVFSTTDKQTGIDYYEVKEGMRFWKEAESPYLLEDQSLNSIIKVKAIDRAGNERVIEHDPGVSKSPVLFIIFILLVIIIWFVYFRFLKRK